MLTATSGEGDTALTGTKEVTVKSGVGDLDVDPTLVKAGSTITVTATGKSGGGTVKVMDSEGMQVGDTNGLDPKVEREDGDVTYSRTITLPADLADGTYTVTVDIQGLDRHHGHRSRERPRSADVEQRERVAQNSCERRSAYAYREGYRFKRD